LSGVEVLFEILIGKVPIPGKNTQSKTVLIVNARAFIPVVIDSTGRNVTYLPPNSNYTMDGTENMLIQDGYGLRDRPRPEVHLLPNLP